MTKAEIAQMQPADQYEKRIIAVDTPYAHARDGEPRFDIVEVTPADAREMLKLRREGHRKIDSAVDTYADAMRSGGWVLNGMPIIFGRNGQLLDGVQRLEACIKADTPFLTVKAENISEDTLHTVDQHRRRLYVAVLEARGEPEAGSLMRMMSKLIRYENGELGMPESQISWMRYDRVLAENPLLREAVTLSQERRNKALKSSARHALIYMGLASGHRNAVLRMIEAVLHPEDYSMDEPGNMLGHQLRIAEEQGTPHSMDQALALGIMALNDTIEGNRRRNVYLWKPDYGDVKTVDGKPVTRKDMREQAPPNLGMPRVKDYPGLRGASFGSAAFEGPLAEIWRHGRSEAESNQHKRYKIEIVTVTPETAQDWLNRYNLGNRRIMPSHVKTIARDIAAGRWMFNAQPICFSEHGRLLNGQHRLRACVEAEEPIDVIVVRNLPDEAFATYDIHARKNVPSNLAEVGGVRADMRVVAAAAKIQWARDRQAAGLGAKGRPSANEIKETIEAHPGLVEACPLARRMHEIASAGVMAFVINYVKDDNEALAQDFLEGLEKGAELKVDNPILKVREALRNDRTQGNYRRRKALETILDTWEAYKEYRKKKG